ncbi:alcohol oxidase [Schizophyllum commune H4-8]|uniref:alcohol oxidase n=1 Tax=Schizophyllum commune (strain H4-8 / FGSC 9210) TaxID=578458 RepID=UPI00215F4BAA|nr:alcohol oxidase [Schizophyllum commune H4-8]KAI5896059.1 alcohol oxidase [Schizophyllum commune H4-8]
MRFLTPLSLALLSVTAVALDACPGNVQGVYDYVVVGSGAGGGPVAARLAEAGFTVLVIDVGHDVHNYNVTVPNYLGRAISDPQLELAYTLDEYPEDFPYTQNDVWYACGVSSCNVSSSTCVNRLGILALAASAAAPSITPSSTSSVIYVATLPTLRSSSVNPGRSRTSGSTSSSSNETRTSRIAPSTVTLAGLERTGSIKGCCRPLLVGHVVQGASSDYTYTLPDAQLDNITTGLLAAASPLIPDINSLSNNLATGVGINSNTIDENNVRSSVYNRLKDVQAAHPDRLHFAFDTLATKVVLCQAGNFTQPRAIGVEVARGAGLPVQSGFYRTEDLKTETIYAKREVIVAAGVFQTPQLLLLSGIGDEKQLSEFGIEPVVHSPGVGSNLQDRDEVSTSWLLKNNYTLFNGCTYGSDPATDPCLSEYTETRENVYGLGFIAVQMPYKSDESLEDPDMDLYWGFTYFPGFKPGDFSLEKRRPVPPLTYIAGVSELITGTRNGLTAIALRSHPSSRGTVTLTGSHPQDKLRIFKNRFQAEGGQTDVATLRDAVKRARGIVENSPYIAPFVEKEIFPGSNYTTDEDVERHVYEQVFGHHACCTAKLGADDDEYAVLDGDFRVRGVSGLRVVDLSAWPNVPGWFPTTPMYMIAEKAASGIIADAEAA